MPATKQTQKVEKGKPAKQDKAQPTKSSNSAPKQQQARATQVSGKVTSRPTFEQKPKAASPAVKQDKLPIPGLATAKKVVRIELSADQKAKLAVDWGIPQTDERFVLASTVKKSHDFMQRVDAEIRPFVTMDHVRQAPGNGQWQELRLAHVGTLLPLEVVGLQEQWNLDPAESRTGVIFNKAEPDNFTYFKGLQPKFQAAFTEEQIRAHVTPSNAELEAALAKRKSDADTMTQKLRQGEIDKKAKEDALAAEGLREERLAAFAEQCTVVRRTVIEKQKEFAINDGSLAAEFEELVKLDTEIVARNPQVEVADQVKLLVGKRDDLVTKTKRMIDFKGEVARHRGLNDASIDRLRELWITVPTMDIPSLQTQCDIALTDQRTLAARQRAARPTPDLATWLQRMGLTRYLGGAATFCVMPLTQRLSYPVHFSFKERHLTRPAEITVSTTAEQLVNLIFWPLSPDKEEEPHVSLETGVTNHANRPKNPHKYWRDGNTNLELYFEQGDQDVRRWVPILRPDGTILIDYTPDQITDALNLAMAELKRILIASATRALVINNEGFD